MDAYSSKKSPFHGTLNPQYNYIASSVTDIMTYKCGGSINGVTILSVL
jgi:hypothetical protein